MSIDVLADRSRTGGRLYATLRRASSVIVVIALLVALGILGVRGLGRWLIVSDTLAPSRAIVVLTGHYPFRVIEAAAIYREGWAQEIWLTRRGPREADGALLRLGITPGTEQALNLEVLRRLDVPVGAARLLAGDVRNTADELKVVAAELRKSGGSAVIIVTSKSHTRRVRAIWRALVGEHPAAVVRYASGDPFHADRWWRYTEDALSVSRETFGLLNVWAGFPLQPNGSE